MGVFDTTDDVSDDDVGGPAGVKNIRYVQVPGPTGVWVLNQLHLHAFGTAALHVLVFYFAADLVHDPVCLYLCLLLIPV